MTKQELKAALEGGAALADLLPLRSGQSCEIFKANAFAPGDGIVYIPDLWLNEIPTDRAMSPDEIEACLGACYAGDDFVRLCQERFGDGAKAAELFSYVDWQHPSSALDAGELDNDPD